MAEILRRHGLVYLSGKKSKDGAEAPVDGILVKTGTTEIFRVAEVKCRKMTMRDLFHKFDGTWLITHQKIKDLAEAARLYGVPGTGLMYLVPDKLVLAVKICDHKGQFVHDFQVKKTLTQATVNGGKAIRDNAFIPMITAAEFK